MPRRIVFPARGQVALQEFTPPPPGPADLSVTTLCSLVSTGTETTILHQNYAPDTHFDRMFSFPQLKTGVQAVARVDAVGDQVRDFTPGDIIFMRMAHGSHQVIAADLCSPVPAGVSAENACWCGLAKTAFRAAWAAPFTAGGSVLIIGAGPVGQMAIRWALAMDMAEVVVVDPASGRLDHARRGGATSSLHGTVAQMSAQIADMNGGEGPPLVVDTTGNPQVFQDALAVLAKFGKLVLLGDTGFPGRQCLTSDMMTRGLTLQATHDSHDRDGWTQRRIDELFFRHVADNRFNLDELITHRFSPEQCEQVYQLASEQREATMGLLFVWHDSVR